ncbi:hypothetical protein M422DRAFT_257349 [Sphaerobolus stellatus SS14]|uniref:Uncharacterized protein n=1 Tax=Sphaerobolus stellatus (strain SS14) TaxID=990650 RepID=A0A0C9VPI2_SPHS4|nr:hypothetical protein M422DRAFT_257349 [Sphaerobolus stellatus SS14]
MATPQKPYALDVLVAALVHQEITNAGQAVPLLQVEHNVNGMWNQLVKSFLYFNECLMMNGRIIGHYYPGAQGYIVTPESMPKLTDTQSDKADLVVRLLNPITGLRDIPILAYEGKGGSGESLRQAVVQLDAFMKKTSMTQGNYSYMVVAKGAKVKFFIYRAGNWNVQGGNLVPLIVKTVGGQPTPTDGKGDQWEDATIFDLTKNEEKAFAYNILAYMVNHPNDNSFTH